LGVGGERAAAELGWAPGRKLERAKALAEVGVPGIELGSGILTDDGATVDQTPPGEDRQEEKEKEAEDVGGVSESGALGRPFRDSARPVTCRYQSSSPIRSIRRSA
jgi:hypothetical protein